MLRALRESNGTAVEIADDVILEQARTLAAASGIFAVPEGAACLAAQMRLLEDGWIQPDESVVIFNTGTGLKYSHLWADLVARHPSLPQTFGQSRTSIHSTP